MSISPDDIAPERYEWVDQDIFQLNFISRKQIFKEKELNTLKVEANVLPNIPNPDSPFFNEVGKKEAILLGYGLDFLLRGRTFSRDSNISTDSSG